MHDRDLGRQLVGVVRADLRTEAVLQRRDESPAVGVVLGVRGGDHHDVEVEAHQVTADLHVALFEHVEQADLDALGEVGQLVHREDAAVGLGHETVAEGLRVVEEQATGDLDGVDLADEVGHRGVGRGQLLGEALASVDPGDRRVVAVLGDQVDGVRRDRREGVVANLRTLDDRQPLVEQFDERTDHAGLRLTALAQQDDVVSGEQRGLELGQARCPRNRGPTR